MSPPIPTVNLPEYLREPLLRQLGIDPASAPPSITVTTTMACNKVNGANVYTLLEISLVLPPVQEGNQS